jgi:RNA polymerase sigma-70 factor (ECF subfamily)
LRVDAAGDRAEGLRPRFFGRNEVSEAGSGPTAQRAPLDAEALFLMHAAFVASFLHRLGTPRSEVDDLVQEVFLVAHRKGGYVPGAAQPRTWLAAIALRIARASRRALGRRLESPDEHALAAVAARQDPCASAEVRQSLARVQHALDALDLEHRAAFVLYELEGESCDSIAVTLDVPVGTVYSRLHHARRRFLAAYAALGGAEAVVGSRLVGGA